MYNTIMEARYYEILGVTNSVTLPELKKAYHLMVKRYHPDSHPEMDDSGEMLREVIMAYRELAKIVPHTRTHNPTAEAETPSAEVSGVERVFESLTSYYETLGIPVGATHNDIRHAYYARVSECETSTFDAKYKQRRLLVLKQAYDKLMGHEPSVATPPNYTTATDQDW